MHKKDKQLLTSWTTPPDRFDSFSLNVNKFFTDVDGELLDKNNPIIPLALRSKYPVYLFNTYDSRGGYRISQNMTPPQPNVFFYRSFVKKLGYDPTEFSGFSTIQSRLNAGDIVFVYTDNLNNPNFFVYIVQSVSDRALASIVESIPCGGLHLSNLRYFSENELNYNEIISLITTDRIGIYKSDNISPLAYKTPDYQQSGLVDIPMNRKLTVLNGFTTFIQHNSDTLKFDLNFLNIKK